MNTTTHEPPLPVWTIRDRLVKAREFAGMTQVDIAKAIGKGVRSVARYETADEPPRTIVVAYAYATGVPLWWLLGEEPGQGGGDRRATPRSTKWEATPSPLKLAA